jgi:hypothetical protein
VPPKVCLWLIAVAFAGCSKADVIDEPRMYSGVWLYQFEGSTFVEGATSRPVNDVDPKKAAWLDYDPEAMMPGPNYDDYDESAGCYPIHAFVVRFIGRRTTSANGSGHGGLWGSAVKVDRLLGAKPLGPAAC